MFKFYLNTIEQQVKQELLDTVHINNYNDYIMVANSNDSSKEMADDRRILDYWKEITDGFINFVLKAYAGQKT